MKIKIKKLTDTAKLPLHGTAGSQGYDLYVDNYVLDGNIVKYYSGLQFEIPKGYFGLVVPRSSVVKTSQTMINSVGIIDSDYRSDITGVFRFVNKEKIYKVGERFAQLVVVPYQELEFEETDKLSKTERGTGGYGSTGK